MEEKKKQEATVNKSNDFLSFFNFQKLFETVILNWMWYLLSLAICLGAVFLYLRYTTPQYKVFANMMIKGDDNGRRNNVRTTSNLGIISNSEGLDNEMEILKSRQLASAAVRNLKLYVSYKSDGRVKKIDMYRNQPISVDVDSAHLERLNSPINLEIKRENNKYIVTGDYRVPTGENSYSGTYTINKTFNSLPASIGTRAGIIMMHANTGSLANGSTLFVTIKSPAMTAYKYAGSLQVIQTSKSTDIARLTLIDEIPDRATDYLKELTYCYNQQANEDKNEVALRTEEFINSRLEKINVELGNTEGALETYKRRQGMVNINMSGGQAVGNSDEFEKKLADANTQISLLNEISSIMNQSENKYQTLPANVGLSDAATAGLINRYNEIVLERNRLLRSASESSPSVLPLTSQLDDLSNSIRRSMSQNRRNMEIQRNAISSQYGKYAGQVFATPEQERILTQIGRQQEVRSGLYLMLLQKREENSISLASTADKGRLIDMPEYAGQVSPNPKMLYTAAGAIGLLIPTLFMFLIVLLRYKIEGHEDVVKLTTLPILADVAIANESAKTKADIVVHENENNQMEEIFRSMRTNLQFILKEKEKVVMFTSTTSGEGKTFNAANLSVSFALLGKRVILVGLDIRKPRLAELFEIHDHHHGITPLLAMDNPSLQDVRAQILPSGINDNLDLLMAGPIPPNPAELIAKQSLDIIFDILKQEYDYILIDTAPVGLVTDTLQIGRVSDATVYMSRADYTPKSSFGLINELSEEGKLPKMSVVLNGVDMSKKKYGYYYGYGKYGKYGRYGNKGSYKSYGSYGQYGRYNDSHYGNANDNSVKL
ncbi:MAG: polysaccharide biosynthesis tyrosine autokinase [Prevotellaceae bacterium]|nr:polysaccharide biosynthesis tyrosine autokinase [Prevotellaceae bacterium]